MRFSLIIATVDRTSELEALLESLRLQVFIDFEVVIVDQNEDDILRNIVQSFLPHFKIIWLRSSIRNNSHARNIGWLAAAGEIIAFPDDDCIYPPAILANVDSFLNTDRKIAFLTGPALSHEGKLGPGRWYRTSGEITLKSVWTSVTEFNFFIRADWLRKVNGFDDSFGLGARFGSAEGLEMALRMMKIGANGFYNIDLKVVHPDKGLTIFTAARAFKYGTGLGRVLRKHKVPLWIVGILFVRPVGGICINLMKLKPVGLNFHWQALRGRLYGYYFAGDRGD